MTEFRRLLQLARPHRGRLALATLILMVGTALNLAIPGNVGALVDVSFGGGGSRQLNQVALTLGGILLLRMVTGVAAGYLLEWTGERIVADLRMRLFARLVYLDLGFFTNTRLGEITSRMTNDVAVIQSAVTTILVGVIE
ncbi:MAG: ABC transporter transmembrane domain-containing protein, partial [Ardenticatenaceae bacterium]